MEEKLKTAKCARKLSKTLLIAALATVSAISALLFTSCKKEQQPTATHTHTFDLTVYDKDGTGHWHPATCEHTDQKGDFERHVFDDGVFAIQPTATTPGTKIYTCEKCEYSYTQTVPALGAADNEVIIDVSAIKSVVYDNRAHGITEENVTKKGDGAVTIEYKQKNRSDDEYGKTKPVNAGEYTVRVKVAATDDYKAGEKTEDFTITARPLTIAPLTKTYDESAAFEPVAAENVASGDSITVTVTLKSADAGTTEIELVELNGDKKENYTIDESAIEAAITPIVIEFPSYGFEKTYDASPEVNMNLYQDSGVLNGILHLRVILNHFNAGTYTANDSISFSSWTLEGLNGAKAENYTMKFPTNSFGEYIPGKITPAYLNMAAEHRAYVNDASIQEVYEFTAEDGLLGNDECKLKTGKNLTLYIGYNTIDNKNYYTLTNSNYALSSSSIRMIIVLRDKYGTAKMNITDSLDLSDGMTLTGVVGGGIFKLNQTTYVTDLKDAQNVVKIKVLYGKEFVDAEEANLGDTAQITIQGAARKTNIKEYSALSEVKTETATRAIIKLTTADDSNVTSYDMTWKPFVTMGGSRVTASIIQIYEIFNYTRTVLQTIPRHRSVYVSFNFDTPVALTTSMKDRVVLSITRYGSDYQVSENASITYYESAHSYGYDYCGTCENCYYTSPNVHPALKLNGNGNSRSNSFAPGKAGTLHYIRIDPNDYKSGKCSILGQRKYFYNGFKLYYYDGWEKTYNLVEPDENGIYTFQAGAYFAVIEVTEELAACTDIELYFLSLVKN